MHPLWLMVLALPIALLVVVLIYARYMNDKERRSVEEMLRRNRQLYEEEEDRHESK